MWSHDERKEIPNIIADMATIRCSECGKIVKKYVPSWYTGGAKCVIFAKYCRYCGADLDNE